MAKKSITKRWLVNNLGVVLMILMIIEMIFIYIAQNYYYGSARQYIVSRLNSVTSILSLYADDPNVNFSSEVRNMLENFSEKDKMELMAINSKGHVVLTSSGFSPDPDIIMTDYAEAEKSEDNYGFYTGKLGNGEKIMAATYSIADMNTEYSAFRVVISLSEIDDAITVLIIVLTAICIAILLLMTFTGMYFIKSIVKPVAQISATAAKFAKGDFSVRIENNSTDEIGELCRAINHMADELSSADAMKNEFISSVSHELRTPLTAIKGWAETIKTECDPVITGKGIKVITNETERLSGMVEDLLDFSRMQNGHFSLQQETMDILAELGDAVLIYAEKARKENITMIYEEPEMLPFVYGDKNRIRQVFINIIDNAIKYSEEGETVKIIASETGNGGIKITVEDNGCGIKKSDLPKIKTKFYKANHTKKGSGIGLAVADEIIAMHGGTLTVESEEGKGTKVTILIPPGKNESKL
ncbi:MAG: HAMP domain-containing histidine kinase [Clostridium sp.]|nr:HAMP domain-containing histidine kinase [Clostridium sp.]MCM1548017.1 HAMP domain-containing histidine kinase [Ruminococcus sp.]